MTGPDPKHKPCEPHPQASPMLRLTADEVGTLADRLFSRGISTLTTYSRREQADLIAASRTLRALVRLYEIEAGRPLRVVLLCGGY
jgi:hypothetical protein